MAASFPSGGPAGVVPDARLFRYGQAEIAFATYVANGADGTFTTGIGGSHMGATGAKCDIHYDRKLHEIECQQMLGPVAAAVMHETCDITASFLHLNLKNLQKIFGMGGSTTLYGGATILTLGDVSSVSGTLQIGDDQGTTFYQVLVKMPGVFGTTYPTSYPNRLRLYQFWKVAVTSIGPASPDKAGHDLIQVKMRAFADPSAAGVGKPSIFFAADS